MTNITKSIRLGVCLLAVACGNPSQKASDAEFTDSETGKFMDGMLSKANPDYASNPDIKWNFTKFLIDRKGRVVARFEPVVTPEQIVPEIEALL